MSLINALKQPQVRKLFGKRELVIIQKQLLGVNLTQSERNRLSRDIRKKFEAITNLAPFAAEFDLKKGVITKNELEEAKEILLESPFFQKIKRIIAYGSAVEGTITLSSDIDVAIEISNVTLWEATLFRKQMMAKLSKRIDVQVYNFLPLKVKREIDLKGRIIYEQPLKG